MDVSKTSHYFHHLIQKRETNITRKDSLTFFHIFIYGLILTLFNSLKLDSFLNLTYDVLQ